ncbi:hypothetical protein Pcinc_021486 [Petrolisthes cinctipes]|uniref:Regulatory protein zeste n=1 Tax=Petrolisthes cinctipes TaxID=88211 RepID=A0AAE1KIC3_PETCI|nr:hypothetical protein Pcinc_021486 [Petrolisthes cinctipes]
MLHYFRGTCYYLNSAVNPILYSVMSVRFRNALRRSVCGGREWARRNHYYNPNTPVRTREFSNSSTRRLQITSRSEMAKEPPMKAIRRPRFTEAEMLTIVQEVEQRADTIIGKFNSNNTAAMKNVVWEMVAAEVNAVSRVKRSAEEVRRKVRDMRAQVKSKAAAETEYLEGTGE